MTHTTNIPPSDYQDLAEFRYQMRLFLRFSEDAARHAGIEPHQHQLMLAIKGLPDGEQPRISYLAERLQIQHHSAVELVDRTEKKGLILRARAESDRREVHVQLTPEGDRVLADLTQHMRDELRTAAPALVATLRKLTSRSAKIARPKPASRRRGATQRHA